jgi:hypothetical protein
MNNMNGSVRVIIKTNRHTYSEEVVEQLSSFAKIHEYDGRKDFKEAWQKWMEEPDIKNMIGSEVARLTANGLSGDILNRMYKSARYYYRKKGCETVTEPTIRKEYEGLPRSVLKTIDDYIYSEINRNILETEKDGNHIIALTAAKSFTTYCKLHYDVISDLLPPMNDEDKVNKNMREELKKVTDRLKKTYKNRFYNIKVALQDPVVA